ncbi:hypothetical protein HON52_05005 [Candidatus Uhrbacteria bacterium]|nr:hypothetical protein [Candidatus Uhrbacteria bacterium]
MSIRSTLILSAALTALMGCTSHEDDDAPHVPAEAEVAGMNLDADWGDDGYADGVTMTDPVVAPILDDSSDFSPFWALIHAQAYVTDDRVNDRPQVRWVSADDSGVISGNIQFWCEGSGDMETCDFRDGWYVIGFDGSEGVPEGSILWTLESKKGVGSRLLFDSAQYAAYDLLYWRSNELCVIVTSSGLEEPGNSTCDGLYLY